MMDMKINNILKKAFTLAEVLITLTIIGIVAAMTIPTLMSKYKDQATVTKLKKAQSVLSNALLSATAKNGPLLSEYTNGSHIYVSWLNTNISAEENIKLIFNEIKSVKNNYTDGADNSLPGSFDIWGSYSWVSILTQDNIIYGIHTGSPNIVAVCADYGINYKCNKFFSFTPSINAAISPNGAQNSLYTLKKSDTCDALSYDNLWNSCTYWAIQTGKLNKKAGEWFEI